MLSSDAFALHAAQSRTAPNAKPYSAAAAVLLNEILKGTISSGIALHNIEPSSLPPTSAANARYSGSEPAPPPLSHEKRLSMSQRKRDGSLGFGKEEAWAKGLGVARQPQRAWWLDFRQIMQRVHRLQSLVFRWVQVNVIDGYTSRIDMHRLQSRLLEAGCSSMLLCASE